MTQAVPSFAGQGEPLSGMLQAIRSGQNAHAYLITGAKGVGKKTLASAMAAMLMCQAEQDRPCGQCASCYQLSKGHHPDLLWVVPGTRVDPNNSSTAKSTSVDDVRAVNQWVQQHALEATNRVIILQDADTMQPPAQNALLKTLEEPPVDTVFMLLAQDPSKMLSTIVSRCRPIRMKPWQDADMLTMLRQAGVSADRAMQVLGLSDGSIGLALAMARDDAFWEQRRTLVHDFFEITSPADIVRICTGAKEYDKKRETHWLDDIEQILRELRQVGLGQLPAERIAYLPQSWRDMATAASVDVWVRLTDAVCEAKVYLTNHVAAASVMERLLLNMMEANQPWRK